VKLQLQLLICIFLVIGIFSVSQNFIYSQTTQEEKKVELLSHKVEIGENSGKFIGQVHNRINNNVDYVIIIGTFYDETGEMIGSKSTYTKPSHLRSNMTASFEMSFDEDISSSIASYDVTITWRYPGESEKYSNIYGLNQ
jgi:hypothetical protein